MREIDVLSKSDKRVTVDQVDDELHLFVSVRHASFSFGFTIEEASEIATALQRLVEERLREVRGVAS